LNDNINPARTSVFFMTISPLHISPKNWGNPEGIRCVKETLPYMNYSQPLDLYHDMRIFDLVVKVASSMEKVPVTVINITRMSDYRKDAHTSLYTIRQGKLLTPKQKADPEKFADCIHWCLPGVPDVWNQILYTRILSKSSWHSNSTPPPLHSLPLPPQ
ncbi:Protein ESKIMO 1, partial [Dichanthelium oligosanthes]